jgi:hypothetical protein
MVALKTVVGALVRMTLPKTIALTQEPVLALTSEKGLWTTLLRAHIIAVARMQDEARAAQPSSSPYHTDRTTGTVGLQP